MRPNDPTTLRKSQAKEIDALFSKKKKLLKSYYKTVDFKEPVLILLRRTMDMDFYEQATSGNFEFTHSDGTQRKILLTRSKIFKFSYLDREVRGFICHEDNPFPMPEEPLLSAEMYQIALDKTLHDVRKWKVDEINAKTDMIWKVAAGIALIIVVMAVAYTMGFDLTGFLGGSQESAKEIAKQAAIETKQQMINNATVFQ